MHRNNKSKDFIEKTNADAVDPQPDEEKQDTVVGGGGGARTRQSNVKPQKLKWQSLADAGHPKPEPQPNEEGNKGVARIPQQCPKSSAMKNSTNEQETSRSSSNVGNVKPKARRTVPGKRTTLRDQGGRTARSSALKKKFDFHDMVMERVRQAYPRRSSNEGAPTDIEVLTWWNNVLRGIESPPYDAESSEDQSLATSEEMEMLRAMSVDEIDQMAQQFLQERNSEEEEDEVISNTLDSLPVANQVSARNVTIVPGEDDGGGDHDHRETVVTGFLVVDRKVLREPIFESVRWLTPLFLLISGALLLVILVVSLTVSLTNTDSTAVFLLASPSPSISALPSFRPSFSPSAHSTARPSMLPTFSSRPSLLPSIRPSLTAFPSRRPSALPSMAMLRWSQVGTDVIGTADNGYLGWSVSLSANGNVLMATGRGILRVYLLAGTDDWMLNEDLSDSLTSWGRVSVSLDGVTIVASDDNHNDSTGRALVYRRVGAGWEQRGDPLVGEARYDDFGRSVALSSNGTIVVVGAYLGGYVCVYRDEEGASGNHTLVARIKGDSGDSFGVPVATSGDATRLIVGAYRANVYTGAAFAYSLFPETALLQRMDGDEAGDYFGSSVALSSNGEVLAVGALLADYVKVYAANDSSRRRFLQLADRLDGPADFGWALSLSADGTRLAVGAFGDDQNGYHSGRAFVYAVHPRRHQKIGEFGGDAPGDYFGESVSLSEDGTRLAVGAHMSDVGGRNSGHVCVFESA